MFLSVSGSTGDQPGVVNSVDSSTQVTLCEEWTGTTATGASSFRRALSAAAVGDTIVAVAFAGRRLLLVTKRRVYVSAIDDPYSFTPATDYLQFETEQLIGAEGLGNSALAFGANGVYSIDNLELALVDDFGNIQVSSTKINSDLVLWADSGLAAYKAGVVCPRSMTCG
jgi:hypothetical protein